MKLFLIRRWFLLTLAAVVVVGMVFAQPLTPLVENKLLREGVVAVVLFLMALPLEARAMWKSLRRPWAPLLAVSINSGLLPLFTWLISGFLSRDIALGMFIAAATPCTLASASVWTRRAGGNDSAAILVTIITNVSCFVVTPLWLLMMTGQTVTSTALDVRKMIVKLLMLVVLPMVLAQLFRLSSSVRVWATERKTPLGVAAQVGVLTMVLCGSIQSGPTLFGSGVRPLIEMTVAVVVVHCTMFVVGFWLARGLRMTREDQIAVGFSGSQKTLMVGLQVGLELGYTVLPMVAYHVSQLLIDTVIADQLRHNRDNV